MVRRLLLIMTISFSLLTTLVITPATVGVSAASSDNCVQKSKGFLGFPTWYKYLKPHIESGECKLTFRFPRDTGKVLLAVVEILLRIAGLVAVGFVIYGGFRYMLSQGDPEQNAAARSTIINALIGVVITIIATVAVSFVAKTLTTT